MNDPRLTPCNGRVAHVSLKGVVEAGRFVEGEWRQVSQPVTDILHKPNGSRLRQALFGEHVLVLEDRSGHAFVQTARDGYVGYVTTDDLAPAVEPTHWVKAAATHLYSEPDLRKREIMGLSFGAFLTIAEPGGTFSRTIGDLYVPTRHLAGIGQTGKDPAGYAELFLGTPYLWGGNSRAGIDCSGLVQAALLACGIDCPGDSDLQEAALGQPIPPGESLQRNDLLFWKGHVALCLDAERMIHANAFDMAVAVEGIDAGIERITAQGDGPVTARKRLGGHRTL